MRVLVTRPEEDASALTRELTALGHTVLSEPLLKIVIHKGPQIVAGHFQAIVLTSANGARAAACRLTERAVPVIAVGPSTAETARTLGFSDVSMSPGDGVEHLLSFIASRTEPRNGTLLHIAGSHVAGNLKEALRSREFAVETLHAYTAVAASRFTPILTNALKTGAVDVATFFSPRTAEIFATLVREAGAQGAMVSISALAISQNTAKALSSLTFRKLFVAHNATQDAMLGLLKTL